MKKSLLFSFFILILVSCGPRLVYPHLDWLVPWYISDYISLDNAQKDMLQKRLLKQLDWHCRTQLPAYADTLRGIGRDFANADQSIEYSKIQFYITRLMALWKELLKQIGPDITDIMITASDAQIDELFDNLAKQNQKFSQEYVDLAAQKLNEKRQKRMIKNLKYWISNLTTQQIEAVSAWSTQLAPISEEWLLNREMIQAEARRLLSQRNGRPEFRAKLLDLIINPELRRSSAYQRKIDTNIDLTIKFIIRLARQLTAEQRSYLLKRIESLAADFDKLSCDPKDVPIPRMNL
ncbi:MAG: hypothetical protein JRF56_09580 [Deltaproteobacteria bacterium]|jgi:hypothetical protein|nr:hypothetical protein [Deltaproteobacteria bacterium]